MVNVAVENVLSCPVCGHEGSEFRFSGRDRLHGTTEQAFAYKGCAACSAVFQSPRPVRTEVWKCYPSDYGPHGKRGDSKTWSGLPGKLNQVFNRLADLVTGGGAFRKQLARTESHLAGAGTMLDFGCGAGKYLDRAKKFGCAGIGMDFSPEALAQVRARGHTALAVDDESWAKIPAGSIGFVRMNHVIEHLYDPADVLRKLHSVMKPGAMLHVSTPNPAGYSATEFQDAWFGLDCPRHIVLMPPDCVRRLFREVGFEDVEIIQDPHPKDLVRSWAYRRMDRGLMQGQDVTALAGDGVLNLFFGLRMARAVRNGHAFDRYHVIARKRA